MTTTDKEFLGQVKGVLKRVPGTRRLNSIRHDIIRVRELSNLIKEDGFVVLHPYSGMDRGDTLTHEIVHDVVKDLLQVYGTMHLQRTTAASTSTPTGAVLLYAPLALLRIPSTYEEYLEQIGYPGRRKVRKAGQEGYEFQEFVWNDHLEEIFEINTSKQVRQSVPMRGWYREPVQPRHHSKEEQHYRKYYGVFKDGKLYAYLHAVLCGDFAFFRHFIGHAQHLPYGVMYALVSWTVREYVGNSQIRWLKYGELSREQSTMHQFRKTAGFQGYATLLDLEGDQELLKYSEHMVRTWWRV
jgi:hypothetical protein